MRLTRVVRVSRVRGSSPPPAAAWQTTSTKEHHRQLQRHNHKETPKAATKEHHRQPQRKSREGNHKGTPKAQTQRNNHKETPKANHKGTPKANPRAESQSNRATRKRMVEIKYALSGHAIFISWSTTTGKCRTQDRSAASMVRTDTCPWGCVDVPGVLYACGTYCSMVRRAPRFKVKPLKNQYHTAPRFKVKPLKTQYHVHKVVGGLTLILDSRRVLVGGPSAYRCWEQNASQTQILKRGAVLYHVRCIMCDVLASLATWRGP